MSTQPETKPAGVAPQYEIACQYVASGETLLHCSRCNRPLMPKDAVRTPTGYVCPYYVKARVATFYNATSMHYAIVAVTALALGVVSGIALSFIGRIGFFSIILTIFAGPFIGGLVAEAIRRVLRRTRGQYFWLAASIGLVIGAAWFTLLPALGGLLSGSLGGLFGLIPALGLVLAVSTLIARMRI